MKQNKTGFTLTELLIVVLVIGILSAVALPKFTRTLETYKTAEAEQMLAAVRDEQEARCTLGDPYTTNSSELGSWATDTSQHFSYTLQEGGMTATRTSGEYSLSMPSYLDGRICCEGCENLNKDYMSCADLMASADYRVSDECGVTPPPPPPPPSCVKPGKPDDVPCGCQGSGRRTYTWNEGACQWELGSTCVGEDTAPCSCVKPAQPADVPCGCNNTGHKSYTWNESACKWELGNECVQEDTSSCTMTSCAEFEGICGNYYSYYTFYPENEFSLATAEELENQQTNAGMEYVAGICCREEEVSLFKPVVVSGMIAILEGDSAGTVYANAQTSDDLCNFTITGAIIPSCQTYGGYQNLCKQCNPTAESCSLACYDEADLQQKQQQLPDSYYPSPFGCQIASESMGGTATAYLVYDFGNPNFHTCQGKVAGYRKDAYFGCGHGYTGRFVSDYISNSCTQCSGLSYPGYVGGICDGSGGIGNYHVVAGTDVCMYPRYSSVKGYACEK